MKTNNTRSSTFLSDLRHENENLILEPLLSSNQVVEQAI
jgi:hypothetical protein